MEILGIDGVPLVGAGVPKVIGVVRAGKDTTANYSATAIHTEMGGTQKISSDRIRRQVDSTSDSVSTAISPKDRGVRANCWRAMQVVQVHQIIRCRSTTHKLDVGIDQGAMRGMILSRANTDS